MADKDEIQAKAEARSKVAAKRIATAKTKANETAGDKQPAKVELSPEQRQAIREKAATTSSGQGQPYQKGKAAAIAAGRGSNRILAAHTKRPAMKILFFVDGSSPTQEEYEEAQTLGMGVVMRNARKIVLGAPLENCDAVAGKVPDDYAAVFPEASSGMEIDDADDDADLVLRPNRTTGQGRMPDDVRPGTVDTGLAHASGTGSSQPGVGTADPTKQGTDASASDAQRMSKEWKTGNTPGATPLV